MRTVVWGFCAAVIIFAAWITVELAETFAKLRQLIGGY